MVSSSPTDLDPGFWRGRRVLVTGHTGFKGGWLTLWLAHLGASVTGVGLEPNTSPSLFTSAGLSGLGTSAFLDIRDREATVDYFRARRPEVVFHLAAQPLVRESYRQPEETFATNVIGTVHVLEAMRWVPDVRVAVMITTDKVYANRDWAYPYRETDTLGGHDPYAASKAACELAIDSYRLSFLANNGIAVASTRAGNVIGGGDWAADRIIPDLVRAWSTDQTLIVRRPNATRPWQHVLEPLHAYLVLAQRLWTEPSLAQAYNIGPPNGDCASVRDVVTLARTNFGRGKIHFDEQSAGPHESNFLALETAKARGLLGIEPRWSLTTVVQRTMNWYRAFGDGAGAKDLCMKDIIVYEEAPCSVS